MTLDLVSAADMSCKDSAEGAIVGEGQRDATNHGGDCRAESAEGVVFPLAAVGEA